jgi:23S rRNA (uridine2552-2'-O)-methyltransferase
MLQSGGYRSKFTKVKTAAKRKKSSNRWLLRQLNDPYVERAKLDGYRSRAAYKLLEINEKFHILKPGMNVIDLGAAPGGWSQIAANIIQSDQKYSQNKVLALDLLPIDTIPGVISIQQDFFLSETKELIKNHLSDKTIDIVLSDMASNTTGHKATDHLKIMDLCENVFHFALEILKPGGCFVTKIFKGGIENELLSEIKQHFAVIKYFKPKSSRKESSESYLVAVNRIAK